MEIAVTIILVIALFIYLKMYNSHSSFLLDKNGVVKKEFRTKFSSAYIEIKPDDFRDFPNIHKKYFPNGECKVNKSSACSNNTLYINTTVSDSLYFPVDFIVRKVKESPETYYMYLSNFSPLYINEGNYLKGQFYSGSISELKKHFESWEKRQLEFIKQHSQT